MSSKSLLFEEICSQDFLKFQFGQRGYRHQLNDAITKTGLLAGVKVELLNTKSPDSNEEIQIVWVTHSFEFLGGSLGCAEGEKIVRAFEYASDHNIPVVVQCRSGGARMQEGTSSLMQMAKVSVAVQALQNKGLPFISVLCDPTYGGVSASYAMQSDIKIAMSNSRIGFAGGAVILNTMCEGNQLLFDQQCPPDFQAAKFVFENGQVDMVIDNIDSTGAARSEQELIEAAVASICSLLSKKSNSSNSNGSDIKSSEVAKSVDNMADVTSLDVLNSFNYTKSRIMTRPQVQDIVFGLFDNFVELSGDGKVGRDVCLRGGIAKFRKSSGESISCVVIGTFKGHTPTDMQNSNYGMPSPHGYRTALRLMKLAERFSLPVVTLVDTVGAWPTFNCEADGQSEAIATNLTCMAGLRVPIVTLMVGEGGSGGALGICMGNVIGMLSGGYFGVISPEGAASILGRYKDEAHKQIQFPLDCQELAKAQCIYAHQLKDLGVVDHIIWETDVGPNSISETYLSFPVLKSRIHQFINSSIENLCKMDPDQLIAQRYSKYRSLGTYSIIENPLERSNAVRLAKEESAATGGAPVRAAKRSSNAITSTLLTKHLSEEVVLGPMSKYRKLSPSNIGLAPIPIPTTLKCASSSSLGKENAKMILDKYGPAHLSKWIQQESKSRVLLTDTTMRDAHQSLLATRVRSIDLIKGSKIASVLLNEAFSLEMWGGATFDVCMRFLDECPWERLREIRKACPNICFQMLIRGANAVGYTSYPDNVVQEFIHLAAKNGMDIFRIFDCFNIVDNMRVAIDATLAANKVAEVCICYTGMDPQTHFRNLLTSKIYNVEYYASLAKEIKATGAHILAIKDMAGLLRPMEVEPLMHALRAATENSLPIHFHTHATSSGSLATCMEMARCGCDIIDFATASMADGTSQPSLNSFVAMMEGAPRDTQLNFINLEPYDIYWSKVRDMYSPFESGMKSGTARVFEHQIPGGQYSNLIVQCQSMGLYTDGDKWEQVLDAYRDVNALLGDVVKVTPSSKCVGDLALYLVNRGLTTADLLDPSKNSNVDFPESVVGLFRGDLGFPHRGFPKDIEEVVLKGDMIKSKRTIRAGIMLTPVNFDENIRLLSEQFNCSITPELGMSSLMYPKVFSDYMKRIQTKTGSLISYIPTPLYLYGMIPSDSCSFHIPVGDIRHILIQSDYSKLSLSEVDEEVTVTIILLRVSSLQKSKRSVQFKVQVKSNRGMIEEDHSCDVKDSGGVFVFEGVMADASNKEQVASPMPGVIEKLLIKSGDQVEAGDTLCIVSAMKMEVKVTAAMSGVVHDLQIPAVGYRVVEGALLMIIK
eukprot:gene8321-11257_t